MRAVVILPDRNSVQPPHDWSGEFRPRAMQFAKVHGVPLDDVHQIDLGQPRAIRMVEVLNVLTRAGAAKGSPLECVAFFCHGLHAGLPQFALGLDDAATIAGVVASTKNPGIVVTLYACSTASGGTAGDGGFADVLRDALCRAGSVDCRVVGHATAGTASVNPHCRVFAGGGSPVGGIGGHWVVEPGSKHWKRWVEELRTKGSDLWARFPFMTDAELEAELEGPK